MTNGEKYATAHERNVAFVKWCDDRSDCSECPLKNKPRNMCAVYWLDFESERQLPCPFCGGTDLVIQDVGGFELECQGCGFHTPSYMEKEKLISEYQRVARAVMAEGKKEAK